MNFDTPKRQTREVSLIPLINVIFLLLIFFMVAGTVEGIDTFEVDLPESSKGSEKQDKGAIIYLSEDGKIAVNNDIVTKKNIETIISTLFIDNPNQKVVIKSDMAVDSKKLVALLNIIEIAGGRDVSLVTQAGR